MNSRTPDDEVLMEDCFDLRCCTQYGSQHGRNMGYLGVVLMGRREEAPDVTQHARNIAH
jgi:hypothetical protein